MIAVRIALAVCAMATAGLSCRRLPPPSAALPELALSPQQASALVRIELTRPDDDDPTRRSAIVLERSGGVWRVSAPLRARASADKVAALLANLQHLRLSKRVDSGTDFYERFDLTEVKALHVLASTAANQTVVDLLAGKSSEQGQLVRLPGVRGVFALVNEGPDAYRGFLYTRDLRSWRDPALLSFEEQEVEAVEITNPHGRFEFRRPDVGAVQGWMAAFAPRRSDGQLGPARSTWTGFDASRVDEMLQAYHALAADDFGVPADRTDAGLDDAERTGGVVRLHLRNGARPLVLRVGAPAPQRSRFAVTGGRWASIDVADPTDDGDAPSVLSPWTARWATADASLFERHP